MLFALPEAINGLLALEAGFRPNEHVAIQRQSTFRVRHGFYCTQHRKPRSAGAERTDLLTIARPRRKRAKCRAYAAQVPGGAGLETISENLGTNK